MSPKHHLIISTTRWIITNHLWESRSNSGHILGFSQSPPKKMSTTLMSNHHLQKRICDISHMRYSTFKKRICDISQVRYIAYAFGKCFISHLRYIAYAFCKCCISHLRYIAYAFYKCCISHKRYITYAIFKITTRICDTFPRTLALCLGSSYSERTINNAYAFLICTLEVHFWFLKWH